MRSLWFRGITLGAAILLAQVFLSINIAFEAAGSVPDVEACSFLAGSLALLLLLFPLASCLIAARATRILARRYPDDGTCILRCGSRVGLLGSAIYFITGLAIALAGGREAALQPAVWGLGVLYTLLAALGGRVGAILTLEKAHQPAWRVGEN